jgi:hypothetical protein
MGSRDRAADHYATEAREFLRKRLIGREVAVKMEYTRKVAPAGKFVPWILLIWSDAGCLESGFTCQ